HPWPGNVRELENCLERAVLIAHTGELLPAHVSLGFAEDSGLHTMEDDGEGTYDDGELSNGTRNLRDQERRMILQTLRETGGNRTEASKRLGISIRTLRNKLREYRGAGLIGAA